jgi:hypothetical protein
MFSVCLASGAMLLLLRQMHMMDVSGEKLCKATAPLIYDIRYIQVFFLLLLTQI